MIQFCWVFRLKSFVPGSSRGRLVSFHSLIMMPFCRAVEMSNAERRVANGFAAKERIDRKILCALCALLWLGLALLYGLFVIRHLPRATRLPPLKPTNQGRSSFRKATQAGL